MSPLITRPPGGDPQPPPAQAGGAAARCPLPFSRACGCLPQEVRRSLGDRLADLTDVDNPHPSGPLAHPAVPSILPEARLPARWVSRLDELELGASGLKHRRRPRIGWRSAEVSPQEGPVVRRPQVGFTADQE